MNHNVGVILPAAGSGSRFGEKKQFKMLGAQPLLFHTLAAFLESNRVSEIVIVVPSAEVAQTKQALAKLPSKKQTHVVEGGQRRQDSVTNGLRVLSANCDIVCIHDVARPFVTTDIIHNCINSCIENDGAIAALPAHDTLKEVEPGTDIILTTVDRNRIWQAQTPQVFKRTVLKSALEYAIKNDITGTDEAALAESLGYNIAVVHGSSLNQKITTKDDWVIAEALLAQKKAEQ
ncbi:MAG: 2-C-methyl-D-erythritol 4-phosphate cytidylyltransferase [Candidatus Marinimicrobia bacterium]|nr:2-C-methyl-D-erythritol 4-phosphate cytidylyltransferase [Candidatus Neomarinimicrobiota bacterium]